jgi:hypothetical protein
MKLKDDTVGMEYEMEAGVSVQVEKYMDFWREIPVAKTENKLSGKSLYAFIKVSSISISPFKLKQILEDFCAILSLI